MQLNLTYLLAPNIVCQLEIEGNLRPELYPQLNKQAATFILSTKLEAQFEFAGNGDRTGLTRTG